MSTIAQPNRPHEGTTTPVLKDFLPRSMLPIQCSPSPDGPSAQGSRGPKALAALELSAFAVAAGVRAAADSRVQFRRGPAQSLRL